MIIWSSKGSAHRHWDPNDHNVNESTDLIEPEFIDTHEFIEFVWSLIEIANTPPPERGSKPKTFDDFESLFAFHQHLLRDTVSGPR